MLNTLIITDIIGGWVTNLIKSIEKTNGTHYLRHLVRLMRKNNREIDIIYMYLK